MHSSDTDSGRSPADEGLGEPEEPSKVISESGDTPMAVKVSAWSLSTCYIPVKETRVRTLCLCKVSEPSVEICVAALIATSSLHRLYEYWSIEGERMHAALPLEHGLLVIKTRCLSCSTLCCTSRCLEVLCKLPLNVLHEQCFCAWTRPSHDVNSTYQEW